MNKKILTFALLLSLVMTLIPTMDSMFEPTSAASPNTGWTLVTDTRAMKAYPDLKEYVYQKNATMPPNGQYDKIGLHRLVKDGIVTQGAVFIDPGIYGSGEQLISNPPESNYTADESSSQAIYWANRGFEVYSIDWRTHFLPSIMNVSQASAIAGNWGWNQYISDMKETVEKAKELSGNSKIFLAGISLGGQVAMFYASEYWNQDLKGIILLDGVENPIKFANVTNSYNVTLALNTLAKIGGLAWETPRRSSTDIPPSGMLFAYQNALQNPGAPAEWPPGTPLQPTINPLTNKTWANITEYIAYQMYSTNYSNIYEGYGNISVIVQWRANGDRYYPVRLGVESNAIHYWDNCPYVSYDFDDHYKEIDVPIFAVRSGLWGIPTLGNYTNGTATSDFIQIALPKYGHLDTYTGPYSARDVSEPTYQWMVNHSLRANPYHDPTALTYDVDYSFSFMDVIKANHTYVPADKVANPVQKLTISYDEKPLTCDIKVGGVTYSLNKDFTYTGHVDQIYYNPSFANPALGYLYPSVFSGSEATINYMYNFSAIPGGLEGTLSMLTTAKDAVGSIVSVGGTGDFRNVEVKASYITPRWYETATGVVNMYNDGMVSGWPHAIPTFMTSNLGVTYAQLTDYCTNVWGLSSNPYPTFPAGVATQYLLFNVVIGDKFYLGVSCNSYKGVYDPVAKTATVTYNATWYLDDWYKGVAEMDQGFKGTIVFTLLNYTPANATATPPTPATYTVGPGVFNLQGFGALSGQSVMLRADGAVTPILAKGYAILP